jgi:hypothetical protein
MTLLERLETMRENLLHSHQDNALAERRHEGKHEDHDRHHIDLSTGSEYLDVI